MNNTDSLSDISGPVIVLVGPTAIGKTALSLLLGLRFHCEIISVDSMQVYRYMDIGTAKVSSTDRATIPHHLIDIVYPDEQYDAVRFSEDCLNLIHEIHGRNGIPLLTGGTGLYLRSLKSGFFKNAPSDQKIREQLLKRVEMAGLESLHKELLLYDRISADKIHKNDTSRIVRALEVYLSSGKPLSKHIEDQAPVLHRFSNMLSIGLTCDRTELYGRINLRTDMMVAGGFEDEVIRLMDMGYGPELKSMQSIGYRHMLQYIHGKWTKDQMISNLARDTRHYAKRQYTWFNRDSTIQWHDSRDEQGVIAAVTSWLNH